VVAAAVATAAAAASCHDPVATAVSRGGSLVAAALPTARGALDEHRLVGTDASDLSALAGARAGTVGATLRTQKHKIELQPLKIRGAWGKCHLPQIGEALLPLPRGFGRRRHGTCRRRRCARRRPRGAHRRLCNARPPPLIARRRASPRPPQAHAPLPPLRPSVTGPAPRRSPLPPPPPTTNSPESPGGEPLLLT
jgi:hypothetical protein